MTVQKDVTKNIYVGNGSTRTFPFTFECPAEHPEYIKVYLMQDDGTALATSDYQLDMDARQITYPSSGAALPEGKKLVIMRELPLQQMMNLVNNGPYFAEDVELAFDENVMAMQQIAEKLNRSIIMSVDIDGDAFVNEVPFEAGKSFRIADDGKSIVLTEDPARVLPLAQEAYAQAQAQAQSASASAAAAAKSEDSAAASASEAGNSAQSASVSAASAAESARLAEGYKNVAETAKSDAALYANNAKTSADNATASKEAAQSAANSASNFATDARSSANEAKSYRDASSTYATNAKNYSENVNVFVPSVSAEGVLSWSNKAGLTNPPSVNIKGKDGADGGVTVDAALSDSSTNPVQNKVINEALNNRAVLDDTNTFTSPNRFDDIYMQNGINSLKWYDGSPNFVVGYINSKNYTGNAATAAKATSDSAGNVITETYAKKADVSGVVKSVNGVSPDSSGNVTITVSGGDTNITVDDELSATSTNPVQNKAIYTALNNKLGVNDTARYAYMDSTGYVISSTYVRSVNGVTPDSYGNVAITASGGSGTNITVDSALSSTSTNPVQNRVIYTALTNKLDKTGTALKATKDDAGNTISTTYAKKTDISGMVKSVNGTKPDASGNVSIAVSGGSNVTVDTTLSATSTNAIQNKAVYAALSDKLDKSDVAIGAQRALQDGDGNIISLTYVKSVNGTKPDSNGNVSISTSGGDGGGASTSTQNTWTALQNFHDLMLNREKYTTYVVNGTSDKPVTSTMVYAVIGAFTLDLATLAGLLSASQSSVFTAYFAANADYSLTINNAGKLKYVGSASDIAITSAGLLLNIWMSKDGDGTLTSIVQASKLS